MVAILLRCTTLTLIRWQARIWDVSDVHSAAGEKQAMSDGHDDSVRSCCWSPDGDYIASGGDDNTLRVFDVLTRERTLKMGEHGDWVTSVRLPAPLPPLSSAQASLVAGCHAPAHHNSRC